MGPWAGKHNYPDFFDSRHVDLEPMRYPFSYLAPDILTFALIFSCFYLSRLLQEAVGGCFKIKNICCSFPSKERTKIDDSCYLRKLKFAELN